MDTVYAVYSKIGIAATVTYTAASWTFYWVKMISYDIPMFFNSLVDIPHFNAGWAIFMMIVLVFLFLKLYNMIMRLVGAILKNSMHVGVAILAYYCYVWKINVFNVIMQFVCFITGYFC